MWWGNCWTFHGPNLIWIWTTPKYQKYAFQFRCWSQSAKLNLVLTKTQQNVRGFQAKCNLLVKYVIIIYAFCSTHEKFNVWKPFQYQISQLSYVGRMAEPFQIQIAVIYWFRHWTFLVQVHTGNTLGLAPETFRVWTVYRVLVAN